MGVEVFQKLEGGGGSASSGQQVVDEEKLGARRNGVCMDSHCVGSVFQVIALFVGVEGEFAFFANGDEAGMESQGSGGGEDKSSSVDADDLVNGSGRVRFDESVHSPSKQGGIRENGCDVFELDARFGKVGNVADGSGQDGGGSHSWR